MARDFALDTQAAKEANTGGKRITEPGAYVGQFKAAWYEVNDKGTEAVMFQFVSDSGQEAGPLALYTHNGAGEELPSYKTFNAILACMKQRGIKAQSGKVSVWDFDKKAEVEKTKDIYPALIGPRVGLVLTTEDYDGRNGVKARVVISAPFHADTRQMANEVIESKPAEALEKYIGWLDKGRWHKPLKGAHSHAPSSQQRGDEQFSDDGIPW
jgi:hypothetical protein